MAFTTDPTTTIGLVRLLLGDTDNTVQPDVRLEDEDMNALILLETGTATPTGPKVYAAAVICGSALRAKFLRKAEGSPGPDKVQPLSRAQEIAALIATYRRKAELPAAGPIAGGISAADNASLAADTDRIGAFARLGMMDNPS